MRQKIELATDANSMTRCEFNDPHACVCLGTRRGRRRRSRNSHPYLVCELAELGFGVADLKRRNGVTQLIFATRSGLPGARGAAAHEGDEGYEAVA